MKDKVLIMFYEIEYVLKIFTYSYISLFGIKMKSHDFKIDFIDRILLVFILVLLSLLIVLILENDYFLHF